MLGVGGFYSFVSPHSYKSPFYRAPIISAKQGWPQPRADLPTGHEISTCKPQQYHFSTLHSKELSSVPLNTRMLPLKLFVWDKVRQKQTNKGTYTFPRYVLRVTYTCSFNVSSSDVKYVMCLRSTYDIPFSR